MKKGKRILLSILTLAATFGLALGFSACETATGESTQSEASSFSMIEWPGLGSSVLYGGESSKPIGYNSSLYYNGSEASSDASSSSDEEDRYSSIVESESKNSTSSASSTRNESSESSESSESDSFLYSQGGMGTSSMIYYPFTSDESGTSSSDESLTSSSDESWISSSDENSVEHVHVWGEWEVTQPATCIQEGERHRVCLLDSLHEETEAIDIIPHTEIAYEAREATCTEIGWEDYVSCLYCPYTTYKEIPINGEHDLTDVTWKSKDNVTMAAKCNRCEEEIKKEVPACEHFLVSDYYVAETGMLRSSGEYVCEYCAVSFDPYDVIKIKFSNAEEEGYYRMEISAKVPFVEYDHYGIAYASVDLEIAEGCSFTYQYSYTDNNKKIRELIIGENIISVGKIDYYNHLYTLTFGEQVQKLRTDCTCDLFSLREIYFEGDLPELEADALWRRNASVEGEPYYDLAPIVYYEEVATGFAQYGYKLQGCGLRMIGEEAKEAPEMTMYEYGAASNARSIEMAKEWFEQSAKTYPFLQFYPFCKLDKYQPIKDLALSLTKELTTDKEKARVIFDWIVENIAYDNEATYYPVEQVFEERKAVCAGYAGLLHDMLAAVEIPSIYASGLSYFGTDCTVKDILNEDYGYKYRDNGHGWLICLLDGEPLICDATWGNFAITAEELTDQLLTTTRLNGVNIIPEGFDPALYSEILYYDKGELYSLVYGYLSEANGFSVIINFTYQFSYTFRAGNDGYNYGLGILDCQSAYNDVLICYGESDYKNYSYFGANCLRYGFVDILKFVAFEYMWYGNQIEIDLIKEFLFDEYGTIYHITNETETSVVGTVSQAERLVIAETIGGYKVTSIDDNALQGCYAKEIVLADSIEKIGAQAFMACGNLESIVLPKNLKHIEPGAFAYCTSLKSVTMYTDVEFIGYKDNHRFCMPSLIFEGIESEQMTVYYQGTEEQFNEIFFNDPFTNPEHLTFDTAQYEHVKGYVSFIG